MGAVFLAGALAALTAGGTVNLAVNFLPDGRCAVVAEGGGFRANLTYLPPPGGASELRCSIPATPKGHDVRLSVTLPPGVAPAGGEFPRVLWSKIGSQWTGVASLPAAPAFVRVPQPGPASPPRWLDGYAPAMAGAAFGWNFYGWFVFSAAFIAAYFVWVRATTRRS